MNSYTQSPPFCKIVLRVNLFFDFSCLDPFMQAILQRIYRVLAKASTSHHSFSTGPRMSSSGTAASLYAVTVSTSSISGAVPEEAKDKRHHLKDGKGFTNPWVRAVPNYRKLVRV